MALFDHFHAPLVPSRQWHGFHQTWAVLLALDLNERLPAGYYAEPNVHFNIEIDVAAFETELHAPYELQSWQPEAPVQTVPLEILTDLVEVQIFNQKADQTLAGAIELVSPSNKDRGASREAFVSKCAAYLQQGLGLLLVDVVTERRANLHDALLQRVSPGAAGWGVDLYAASYHPVGQNGHSKLDLWREELSVGQTLPTLPLWLRGGLCLPLDLDATYAYACQKLRLS